MMDISNQIYLNLSTSFKYNIEWLVIIAVALNLLIKGIFIY